MEELGERGTQRFRVRAGLGLTCELGRRDARIRLIDSLPEPAEESRVIVVPGRSLEMMDRIGVVDELIASRRRATAMKFHADGGTQSWTPHPPYDSRDGAEAPLAGVAH